MNASSCSARVLVIDNDPRVGRDLERLLGRLGYHVRVAEGVGPDLEDHAVDLAHSFRPHVAIVDLRLKDDYIDDRSGLALLQRLRFARCILYSAYLRPEVTREAHGCATTWVSKRESPQLLIEAVNDAALQVCASQRNLTVRNLSPWTPQRIVETLFGVGSDVPPELVDDILGQMFPATGVVTLETLEGAATSPGSVSRGRSVVLKAWRNNRKEPLVVKLAPTHRIDAEGRNYAQYIADNLRGMFHARLEGGPVTFWDLGGVLYSFVGASSETLPSFASFYQEQSDSGMILRPLNHLFSRVWNDLYAEPARLEDTLFNAYATALRLEGRFPHSFAQQLQVDFPGVPVALPNPTSWVSRHKNDSALPHTRQAVTHGDLHADNLFVDESHAWAIDFERSGPGPILRDFAELEVDILTRLVSCSEVNLFRCYQLDVVLAGPSEPTTQMQKDPETRKALDVIGGLRGLAFEVTRVSDFREYLWGLLLDALFVATSTVEENPQRERALLLGAVLCERLRRWGREWPPREWPLDARDDTAGISEWERGWSSQLRQVLAERFSEGELHILCSDLGVEHEDLPGSGRVGKAQALIEYLGRRNRVLDLFAAGRRLRSDIPWDELQNTYEAQQASSSHP